MLAVPGVRFRSHNLAMVTLVFQAVVIIVLRESKTLTGGAEGMHVPPPVIFGISFANDASFLLLCGVLYALVILPMTILLAGPFGKNLRALASNENAARAFGIDVRHHLIAAFTWSSALIAFAGAVSAPRFRIIDPDSYGIFTSIFTLAYPIIGGMGSIWGGLARRRHPARHSRAAATACRLHRADLLRAGRRHPDVLSRRPGLGILASRSGAGSRGQPGASARRAKCSAARIAELFVDRDPRRARTGRASPPMRRCLQVEGVSKSYGALRAVDDVSLIGRARLAARTHGPERRRQDDAVQHRLRLRRARTPATCSSPAPRSIRCRSSVALRLGMTRTFQHAAVFQRLSCLDNVIIGLGRNSVVAGHAAQHRPPRSTPQTARAERRAALAALEAVGLGARTDDVAGALSLGDQRRLEIARAIVSRPQLILLDEPVSGVSVEEAQRLRELLLAINRELGIAMVVIEHNIGFLASLCQRISVMSEGRILAEGDAAAIIADPRVRHAYFGEQEVAA